MTDAAGQTGTAATAPPNVVLVVPVIGVWLGSGAGQRTQMFFEAARALGPVTVIAVGEDRPEHVAEVFPGAAAIHVLPHDRIAMRRSGLLVRLANGWRRLLRAGATYAADPEFEAELRARAGAGPGTVWLIRYLRSFCVSGLAADAAGREAVAVDVDDRDDQRYLSYVAAAPLGRVTAPLAERTVVRRLAALLKARMRAASHVWFATDEDVWPIEGVSVSVAPNTPAIPDVTREMPPPSASRVVLFVGVFANDQNQRGVRWFLRECWPEIRRRQPDAVFRVVGFGPWDRLRDEGLPLDGVEIVGGVDDLAAEYAGARLAVSPIFDGGGSKIKLIEACAYGRAVVSTEASTRGFGTGILSVLSAAETPQSFTEACCALLGDDARADAQGRALQDYQRTHFSRDAVVAAIRRDLEPLAARVCGAAS